MFDKILIANRGEIAVRVIKTAKDLGYHTVAVYSDADSAAPHVALADESVHIGASPAQQSYLDTDKIIAAAKKSGATAIHPGYGFLSENADFAKACGLASITFIGPSAFAIELMGNKRQSKIRMIDAGVPCIPGYEGEDQQDETLINEAGRIGYPVMVKAAAGGGGRGMRLVEDDSSIQQAIKSARSEAVNAFGNGELILEKAVSRARHIEIQIIADQFGHTLHLGERDCSVQRRHQKVVEESPSLAVSDGLRELMGNAAVAAAKACDYVGAGTVEFLLDSDNNFYFLEMNTRLQVEHPVTEMITGLDLVEMQLSIANGQPLSLAQDDVVFNGHAIEVRLYAEDPAQQFMPQTGDILLWQPGQKSVENTGGAQITHRVDSGITTGQRISAYYDPMLAKLIAYGANREQARRRLIRLIKDSHLLGVRDNRSFLCEILSNDEFIMQGATTDFINEQFACNKSLTEQVLSEEELALAAVLMNNAESSAVQTNNLLRTSNVGARIYSLTAFNQRLGLSLTQEADRQYQVSCAEQDWQHTLQVLGIIEHKITYTFAGVTKTKVFAFETKPSALWLESANGNIYLQDTSLAPKQTETSGSNKVAAAMDGMVVDIVKSIGERAKKGELVAVVEAMKMEHQLNAEVDGTVEAINVKVGDQVKAKQILVQLVEAETENKNLGN